MTRSAAVPPSRRYPGESFEAKFKIRRDEKSKFFQRSFRKNIELTFNEIFAALKPKALMGLYQMVALPLEIACSVLIINKKVWLVWFHLEKVLPYEFVFATDGGFLKEKIKLKEITDSNPRPGPANLVKIIKIITQLPPTFSSFFPNFILISYV